MKIRLCSVMVLIRVIPDKDLGWFDKTNVKLHVYPHVGFIPGRTVIDSSSFKCVSPLGLLRSFNYGL